MTPVDFMLGPVCLECCKEKHAEVLGKPSQTSSMQTKEVTTDKKQN